MKNTQENGPARLGWRPSRPRQEHHKQQGSESGDQPASDGDSGPGRTTGSMATMFDSLRDAAAEHDDDCDLLPLLQHDAATGKQPKP